MPLRRDPDNPLLTPADIPAFRPDLVDVTSVFNPGAARWRGRELLLLRVQTRGRTTVLLPAERTPTAASKSDERSDRSFDSARPAARARLRPAPDSHRRRALRGHGLRLRRRLPPAHRAHRRFRDTGNWSVSTPDGDRRNGVLFPERVGGRYLRLRAAQHAVARGRARRPATPSSCAASDDLITWEEVGPVMAGRPGRWDELIGSGPPPVKTREGWLHLYHGVATHFAAANIYQAGVVLLDLDDPCAGDRPRRLQHPRAPRDLGTDGPGAERGLSRAGWWSRASTRRVSRRRTARCASTTAPPTRSSAWPRPPSPNCWPTPASRLISATMPSSLVIPLGRAQPRSRRRMSRTPPIASHDRGDRRAGEHEPDPPLPEAEPGADHLLEAAAARQVHQRPDGPDHEDQEPEPDEARREHRGERSRACVLRREGQQAAQPETRPPVYSTSPAMACVRGAAARP